MDERIEDLFPLYALGALTDEERAQVDAYVAANPEARSRLEDMRRTAADLPYHALPVDPAPHVKAALMDRVHADARTQPARRPAHAADISRRRLMLARALPVFAGVSLLVAAALGVWALSLNSEVMRLREEMATLKRELLAQREVLAQIALPGAQAMAITGTEHQPASRGQLIADPQGGSGVLIVTGLKPLEPGKVYQFWLIRGKAPVSAGLFGVDEQGRAVLPVKSDAALASFDAMGVSIEPEGGSPQPTGDIVMLSSLS